MSSTDIVILERWPDDEAIAHPYACLFALSVEAIGGVVAQGKAAIVLPPYTRCASGTSGVAVDLSAIDRHGGVRVFSERYSVSLLADVLHALRLQSTGLIVADEHVEKMNGVGLSYKALHLRCGVYHAVIAPQRRDEAMS